MRRYVELRTIYAEIVESAAPDISSDSAAYPFWGDCNANVFLFRILMRHTGFRARDARGCGAADRCRSAVFLLSCHSGAAAALRMSALRIPRRQSRTPERLAERLCCGTPAYGNLVCSCLYFLPQELSAGAAAADFALRHARRRPRCQYKAAAPEAPASRHSAHPARDSAGMQSRCGQAPCKAESDSLRQR